MSLTVPRAGSFAGRSANLQAPPSGAEQWQALAQLGGTITDVALKLEQDRLQREMNRAQVDLAREMNELSLQMREIGDPDELDRQWTERSAALRQSWLEGTDERGRPRISRGNAEQFGIAFDDLANRVGFGIGSRALDLRHSQREATWLDAQHTLMQTAATGDEATRSHLFAEANRQIDEMMAAGVITPEEAQRRRMDLQAGTANAIAIRMVQDDPHALLQAIGEGQLTDLDAETQARYAVQAQNTIDQRNREADREAERIARERETAVGDALDQMIRIIGVNPDARIDYALLQQATDEGHPKAAEANAAVDLAIEYPMFRQMHPSVLQALITREEQRPVDALWQTERLQLLREAHAEAVQGWTSDPVAFADEVGMAVPPLILDPADPQSTAASIEARRQFADDLTGRNYMALPRVFTDEERVAIAAATAVDANPVDRVELARALTLSLQGLGTDGVPSLSNDPVFIHTGNLLATGMPDQLATEIFRGQQVIAQNNIVLPTNASILQVAGADVAQVFSGIAGGEVEQRRVIETANALYAARMRFTDPGAADTPIDEAAYRQALFEAMGGIGNHDSRDATGGLRMLNGFPTVLPPGVTSSLAEVAIANLGRPSMTAGGVGTTQRARDILAGDATSGQRDWDGARMIQQLRASSPTGQVPGLSADPERLWRDLQDAQFRAVGGGQYEIVWPLQNGLRYLPDTNGEPFRLDLNRLIAEMVQ